MIKSDKYDYQRKIKTPLELKKIIGDKPRSKSVVMCHGTFDIVHPGHIRHLLYVNDIADILVVSLTSDNFITKANFRPFVPEQLRAINLAALEFVDYVVIDNNPTPLENLALIKPDFFAKGADYSDDGTIHPKTQEEIKVVEAYGGEVVFTPGDIVYSSSHIIDNSAPDISLDKLDILMRSEGITFDKLVETIHSFKNQKVHVVGDTIVDSYAYCSPIGWGNKTPTLSVKLENQVDFSGGAAIVAKHLARAGAIVHFSTVLGDDQLKDFVLSDLEKSGVDCSPIIDKTRPTTRKNAIISQGYRLIKVDTLDNRPINDKVLGLLKEQIKGDLKSNIVIFSDFRHGIFSKSSIGSLIDSIPNNVLRVADSQVASRWGNILDFQNFDLITPNEKEARFSLGDQDSVVRPLALNLYKEAKCKNLILKLGDKGIITYRPGDFNDPRTFFTLDSFVEKVVDAVGTGDALLSYASLALSVTGSIVIASILGSVAAAIACENDGNNPVNPEDVIKKLGIIEKKINYK